MSVELVLFNQSTTSERERERIYKELLGGKSQNYLQAFIKSANEWVERRYTDYLECIKSG